METVLKSKVFNLRFKLWNIIFNSSIKILPTKNTRDAFRGKTTILLLLLSSFSGIQKIRLVRVS